MYQLCESFSVIGLCPRFLGISGNDLEMPLLEAKLLTLRSQSSPSGRVRESQEHGTWTSQDETKEYHSQEHDTCVGSVKQGRNPSLHKFKEETKRTSLGTRYERAPAATLHEVSTDTKAPIQTEKFGTQAEKPVLQFHHRVQFAFLPREQSLDWTKLQTVSLKTLVNKGKENDVHYLYHLFCNSENGLLWQLGLSKFSNSELVRRTSGDILHFIRLSQLALEFTGKYATVMTDENKTLNNALQEENKYHSQTKNRLASLTTENKEFRDLTKDLFSVLEVCRQCILSDKMQHKVNHLTKKLNRQLGRLCPEETHMEGAQQQQGQLVWPLDGTTCADEKRFKAHFFTKHKPPPFLRRKQGKSEPQHAHETEVHTASDANVNVPTRPNKVTRFPMTLSYSASGVAEPHRHSPQGRSSETMVKAPAADDGEEMSFREAIGRVKRQYEQNYELKIQRLEEEKRRLKEEADEYRRRYTEAIESSSQVVSEKLENHFNEQRSIVEQMEKSLEEESSERERMEKWAFQERDIRVQLESKLQMLENDFHTKHNLLRGKFSQETTTRKSLEQSAKGFAVYLALRRCQKRAVSEAWSTWRQKTTQQRVQEWITLLDNNESEKEELLSTIKQLRSHKANLESRLRREQRLRKQQIQDVLDKPMDYDDEDTIEAIVEQYQKYKLAPQDENGDSEKVFPHPLSPEMQESLQTVERIISLQSRKMWVSNKHRDIDSWGLTDAQIVESLKKFYETYASQYSIAHSDGTITCHVDSSSLPGDCRDQAPKFFPLSSIHPQIQSRMWHSQEEISQKIESLSAFVGNLAGEINESPERKAHDSETSENMLRRYRHFYLPIVAIENSTYQDYQGNVLTSVSLTSLRATKYFVENIISQGKCTSGLTGEFSLADVMGSWLYPYHRGLCKQRSKAVQTDVTHKDTKPFRSLPAGEPHVSSAIDVTGTQTKFVATKVTQRPSATSSAEHRGSGSDLSKAHMDLAVPSTSNTTANCLQTDEHYAAQSSADSTLHGLESKKSTTGIEYASDRYRINTETLSKPMASSSSNKTVTVEQSRIESRKKTETQHPLSTTSPVSALSSRESSSQVTMTTSTSAIKVDIADDSAPKLTHHHEDVVSSGSAESPKSRPTATKSRPTATDSTSVTDESTTTTMRATSESYAPTSTVVTNSSEETKETTSTLSETSVVLGRSVPTRNRPTFSAYGVQGVRTGALGSYSLSQPSRSLGRTSISHVRSTAVSTVQTTSGTATTSSDSPARSPAGSQEIVYASSAGSAAATVTSAEETSDVAIQGQETDDDSSDISVEEL